MEIGFPVNPVYLSISSFDPFLPFISCGLRNSNSLSLSLGGYSDLHFKYLCELRKLGTHLLCHTDTHMFTVVCEKLGQGPALDESRN